MKIGVMNKPSNSVYDDIESIGEARFDFIDLTIEGYNRYVDIDRVGKLLEKYSLGVVGHTDPCLPYAYPVKEIREACLKELERCAIIFAQVGARVMNVHPCYTAPPGMNTRLLDLNIEALKTISDMAQNHGLTLVLENFRFPFDRIENFRNILTEVPGLGLHLDFGHANLGRDDGATFCRHLGHALKHVHFSDNRTTEDHHMPLGVGSVNWENAVDALKATGYDNTITLEVFCNDPDMQSKYLDLNRKLVLKLWG